MIQPKKNLSYSGYSTYSTCPKKYDYHYNEKLRPETQPFHLVFGSATDKALNEILIGLRDSEDFDRLEVERVALKHATKELCRLFKEKVNVESKDFDIEIITELTSGALLKKLRKVGWQGSDVAALASDLFGDAFSQSNLSKKQKRALKYLIIASSLEKISLIIDSFFDYVVPKIVEIVSVQTTVKRGILDFEAKLMGVDGIVICDNKTAGRDYEQDAVLNSVQLAGYGAKHGAYIVFNKTVRKNRTKSCAKCGKNGTGQRHKTCDNTIDSARCNGEWIETVTPEIIPQILIDEIPVHNRAMVEEAYAKTEQLIETNVFPRNLNNCGKQFGQPCPYINLCWKNDRTGLKKE